MKLTEPQKRALRALLELKCWISVYKGLQLTNRGRAWFVWAGQFLNGRRVRLGTVEALERRGLIKARGWPYALDVRYRNLVLTPKGRELAEGLEPTQCQGCQYGQGGQARVGGSSFASE